MIVVCFLDQTWSKWNNGRSQLPNKQTVYGFVVQPGGFLGCGGFQAFPDVWNVKQFGGKINLITTVKSSNYANPEHKTEK